MTLVCCSSLSVGQNAAGRVIGTVTDEQGAAISAAKVIVNNTGTNVNWETKTDTDGSYQILDLPIGNYRVTVEHAGFSKSVTGAQALEINQSLRIDVRLKVGAINEVVEVLSESAQVETVNPTVGETVTGAAIQNLPLNGRNTLDLALTQPGVAPAPPLAPAFSAAGVLRGQFSVAGGRDDAVTYLLDGGDNTSSIFGVPIMNPNPDTIAEFRILDNNYTAEYGRSAGGVVSVVTKSGTDHWHGSAFDYLRNDALNANTFFNNGAGQPRPPLKRNQFGGTVGGPIVRDRAFFFFGYQGQRQTSVVVGNTVPVYTPAELQGNFFGDTTVANFLQNYPYYQQDPTLAAQGIIDPTKIDPVALAYISAGLIPSAPGGVVTPNGNASDNRDEYIGKFDFSAKQSDRISATLSKFHDPVLAPFVPFGVSGFPYIDTTDSYFGQVSTTHTFSPRTLNEFHFTAQRLATGLNAHASKNPGPADLGIHTVTDQRGGPPALQFPVLQLGYPSTIGFLADNTYVFSDSFMRVEGRHTFKVGGSINFVQANTDVSSPLGQFQFAGAVGPGNTFADFLLGISDGYAQQPASASAFRTRQYAGFFQDEWRVTPRLVLTLGIHYEYDSPKHDPQGRQLIIIPGLQSQRIPNAPIGLVFPGDPGAPDGNTFPDRNGWAPRSGFAWDPFGNGKMSVRGGLGVFYDAPLGKDNILQANQSPFYTSAGLSFNPAQVVNGQNTFLSFPFQTAGVPVPSPQSDPQAFDFQANAPYGDPGVNGFIDPHLRNPYIYMYNLSLERQLGKGLAAGIGYVGSSSHKLVSTVDRNPMIQGTSTRILNTQPGITYPDAFGPLQTDANVANAAYNGLLASLTKRMGDWHSIGQTFFTLSYTWSHEIDDAEGLFRYSAEVPAYNHHQFRASGDSDIRSRLVFSGGWELPFAHLWNRGPKRLTSGWTLYPIFTAQSGAPIDIGGIFSVIGLNVFPDTPGPSGLGDSNLVRPNWNGGAPQTLDPHPVRTFIVDGTPTLPGHFIFDPSNLTTPPCYSDLVDPPGGGGGCPAPTYGTLPRNFFRGADLVNFDLALEKKTNLIGDRLQMMFRVEFFNILNHTQWQNPQTVLGSDPTVGQVTSTFDPRIGQLSLRFTF